MQRAAFIMHSKLALMRANGYIATRFFREHDLEHVKKKYVERQGEAVGSYLLLHRLLCCILLQESYTVPTSALYMIPTR